MILGLADAGVQWSVVVAALSPMSFGIPVWAVELGAVPEQIG